jgi:probable phosphoglycerate mutase
MRIFFVRHGSTVLDAANIHRPQDVELSEEGILQAKKVTERFLHMPLDLMISSDYKRAVQTATIMNERLHLSVKFTPLLRERKIPSELVNTSRSTPHSQRIQQLLKENIENKDWHYSDEENMADLFIRAEKCIEYISQKKAENILVVTHEHFLKIILVYLMLGKDIQYSFHKKIAAFLERNNTGITIVEKIDDDWKLRTWNDYAHLW